MKKSEFYNDVKASVNYLSGLSLSSWYKDGAAIVVKTGTLLVSLSCKHNIVTLYVKVNGKKGGTIVTDFNKGYKENMVSLTAEKISKLLIFDSLLS